MSPAAEALFTAIAARYRRAGCPHPKSWVIAPAPGEEAVMAELVREGLIEPRGPSVASVFRLAEAGARAASEPPTGRPTDNH